MRFWLLYDAQMRFFCFNDIKMRHLGNRLLEKCLISYRFINLELFHPELRNFDQNNMRLIDTGENFIFQILRFWDSRLCFFQSHLRLIQITFKSRIFTFSLGWGFQSRLNSASMSVRILKDISIPSFSANRSSKISTSRDWKWRHDI